MKTLRNVSKVVVIIALLGFACTLIPSSAQAQATGASDIDINLPDIVVLHYFTNIDITISAAALGTFLYGAAGDQAINEGTAAPAAGGFTQDLTMTATAPTGNPVAADLTLQNAWAVRAISLWGVAAQTQVSIALTDNTLTHAASGDTITISSGQVSSSGGLGPAASIQFDPPGLVTPRYGDVVLTLDLSSATWAGDYVDGVFTLTAQNI